MFRKGIVILNAYIAYIGLFHLAERLQEEFRHYGIEIEITNNAEIFSYIDEDGFFKKKDLKVDFIIYLDKDPYIAYMLEQNGFRLFNHAEAIRLCDDKMLTYLALTNHGIAMPKTISAPLCYSNKNDLSFLNHLEKELAYPFISKTNYGSQGRGVCLVHNREELIEKENEIAYMPRLYQSFIRSSFGKDFRIIVINKKAFACMKRYNENGDFRSNIALGGKGESFAPPASFIEMAEKAASILDLDYCGVDLLLGESGSPILCEVNSNAFIDGIEKATGKNVAKAYCEHIIKTIY